MAVVYRDGHYYDTEKVKGGITQETDPTISSWAKKSSKPTYTAQEVGALPADTPLFDGDYNHLDNKPIIPVVPTNVSAFVNDSKYVTEDMLGNIVGEDTVELINIIGQKVDEDDIESITNNEISRLFNPSLFLRATLEESGTDLIVNQAGQVVIFVANGIQYIVRCTSDNYYFENTNTYNSSTSSYGTITTPIQVDVFNDGTIWEFGYSNISYVLDWNNLSITPTIPRF